jgi:hypothetical protein
MWKSSVAVVFVLIVLVNVFAEEKLQIGIKKKVDNCETKSKKGDRLHMHYTVSDLHGRTTSLMIDSSREL